MKVGLLGAARRLAVIVAGSVVLLVGIAMIVLPGPAVLVIPLGFGILATELPIARRLVRRAKVWFERRRRGPSSGSRRGR